MTLRNSWPGPSGVTTTTDARIDLGGLIDDVAGGGPRVGVFPSNLNSIVTARSDMNVDIAAFQAVVNQFGGTILLANDGTIQLPSVLVSPASGTNFYVIYVKQDESTSPGTDADNLPKVGNVLSTVSFAAARASLPTGALELATVQVPTGVSATNAGGVTITQTFVYTVPEGGVLPVRNSTELTAWTPADGSLAWQVDIGALWVRTSGAWYQVGSVRQPFTPTFTNLTLGTGGSALASYTIANGWVSGVIRIVLGTGFSITPDPKFTPPVPIATSPNWNLTSIPVGQGVYTRTGTGYYQGILVCDTAGKISMKSAGGAAFLGQMNNTTPVAWAAGDTFDLSFSYPI